MAVCDFCQLPRDQREATWEVMMGSGQCDQIMEFALCGAHKELLQQAVSLVTDKCSPPHPVDEMMMQELDTAEPLTVVLHPDHPRLTPQLAARIFEENVTAQYVCQVCGDVFRSAAGLAAHYMEQHAPADLGLTRKPVRKPVTSPPYPGKWPHTHPCHVCGKFYPNAVGQQDCLSKHELEEKWRAAKRAELDKRKPKVADKKVKWDFSGGREGPY